MQATQIYIYWVKQYIKPYTLTDHLFWGWRYSIVVFLLLTELHIHLFCDEELAVD